MKKDYITPEFDMRYFCIVDVMQISGNANGDCTENDVWSEGGLDL